MRPLTWVVDTPPPVEESYPGYPEARFAGTVHCYHWLAAWYGLDANVVSAWKGSGTALIVLSKDNGPVPLDDVQEFRDRLDPWTLVGTDISVVSVG